VRGNEFTNEATKTTKMNEGFTGVMQLFAPIGRAALRAGGDVQPR
jgi:hypothetical protein